MDFGDVIKAMKEDNTKKFARKGWNGKGIYIQLQVPDEHSKMTLPYIYMVTSKLESDNPDAPRGRVPWLASQTDMLCDDWVEIRTTSLGQITINSPAHSITTGECREEPKFDNQPNPAKGGSICAHVMKELQDYKYDNQPNPDKKYDAVQNPAHYCKGRKYQPWDVMIDWELTPPLDFAVKYIARAGRKQQPGMTMKQSEEQDLMKAINCLQKRLDIMRGKNE